MAWSDVSNLAVGDSITIHFADTTNFNSVMTSDIVGFGDHFTAGATEFYTAGDFTTPAGNGGNPSTVFAQVGGAVTLTYSNSYVGYIQASKNGHFGQSLPGQPAHADVEFSNGSGHAYFQDPNSAVTYTSAQVPEPATLALVGLAMLGLGFTRCAAKQG